MRLAVMPLVGRAKRERLAGVCEQLSITPLSTGGCASAYV